MEATHKEAHLCLKAEVVETTNEDKLAYKDYLSEKGYNWVSNEIGLS